MRFGIRWRWHRYYADFIFNIERSRSRVLSIAPRIKRRKGKRRNARNLFPSPFSGYFLKELSVPDAFDLASSVNGFSACFSLYIHIYMCVCVCVCVHTYISVPPYFFLRAEFAELSVLQQQKLFAIDKSRNDRRCSDLSSYFTHFTSNCTSSSCCVRLFSICSLVLIFYRINCGWEFGVFVIF